MITSRTDQHTSGEATTFVNNFWGTQDSGFSVIQTRIKSSTKTIQELLNYYQERANIEKEYNKKLDKLNGKIYLGSNETGSLKESLDKLQFENDQMCKINKKLVNSISQNNYEKLNHFFHIFQKEVSKIEHHMSKIISKKNESLSNLETLKSKYQQDCSQIRSLQLTCQTTWGKELERYEQKLSKLIANNSNAKLAYKSALDKFSELNEIWIRDWSISLKNFYQLEIERIQLCKINCFNFCNNIATLCVELDQSVDLARSVFAQVLPPKDLQDFGDTYGTGNKIYKPPEFVDFMSGYDDENSNNNYTFADFENPDYSRVLARTYSNRSMSSNRSHHHHHHLQQSPQQQYPTSKGQHQFIIPPTPQALSNPALATSSPINQNDDNQIINISSPTPPQSPVNTIDDPSPISNFPTTPRTAAPLQSAPFGSLHSPEKLPPLQNNKVSLPPPSNNQGLPPSFGNHRKTNSSLHLTSPSSIRRRPTTESQFDNYESGHEDNKTDVFSIKDVKKQFASSNGSSNYSNPTNYSSSTNSNSNERNWASPRRKEKQLSQFQEQINLKSKETPNHTLNKGLNMIEAPQAPNIPITKDFSIDFIAKALEDLNKGGDGDINKYRLSVRKAKKEKEEKIKDDEYRQKNSLPHSPFRPASDYVDDSTEIATRYDSINFSSPIHLNSSPMTQKSSSTIFSSSNSPSKTPTKPKRIRPKSMLEPILNEDLTKDDLITTTVINKPSNSHLSHQPQQSLMSPKHRPLLMQTPLKSYTNLHSLISQEEIHKVTPVTNSDYVTKARAKYTYKPQNHGELYFKKGWYMYVIYRQEDNWYVCELAKNSNDRIGMVGLVPGNYVVEGDDLF